MKLLTLDPSSTAIGYAVTGGPDVDLTDVGVIRPDKPRAQAEERILNMACAVREVFDEYPDIAQVLIEKPSGKVHGSLKHAGGAGLSIYGMGVGAVLQVCHDARPTAGAVQMIDCNVWTRGKSKEARARMIRSRWPAGEWDQDKGLDAQDAIGMAIWWWAKQINSGKNAG